MTISIGKRAKYFRENMGMSQTQAAERSGLSQPTWSRIEGHEKIPTAGEVLGMSWALGVPFDTMRGEGEIRERLQSAARTSSDSVDAGTAEQLERIKEEMIFLMEYAAELEAAGYQGAHA